MFGTIRREATDPSAHRNAWAGAQQQQQQQQQQHLPQHQQRQPHHHHHHQQQQQQQQHSHHHQSRPPPLQDDQVTRRAGVGGLGGLGTTTTTTSSGNTTGGGSSMGVGNGSSGSAIVGGGSSSGNGSAGSTASPKTNRSGAMVQTTITALVSVNADHRPNSEMLSFHEDILDAAARAWDAGYHWSMPIFAVAVRPIIRDVANERREKSGSSLDPAYIEKVTCAIQTRLLAADTGVSNAGISATNTSSSAALVAAAGAAVSAASSITAIAGSRSTRSSPQPPLLLAQHKDAAATAAAALATAAGTPLSAPSISVKSTSPAPSPALSSSVLVAPSVRIVQPPPVLHHQQPPPPVLTSRPSPPQPHQHHTPQLPPPRLSPQIQPLPQPIQPHPQQQQQAPLPPPQPQRQPLPAGPRSQPPDQQVDSGAEPPAKRRRPLPTVGVHSWTVNNGGAARGSPPANAKPGSLAPSAHETISAKRRRRRSDRGGDPGSYRNVGGYGDITSTGYGYGYTGTIKCTLPTCDWTAVTTSMRMGLRLNDHLLRKHGIENAAIRLRPSYIRRMPRSHAAVRVVAERPAYRAAREALIRVADGLAASRPDWLCPEAVDVIRRERVREVFPNTDDVKSLSGKDLREELVRMRTGDGLQEAAAAIAAENSRLGIPAGADSPLEVWTREHFVPWQNLVKEGDAAAAAAAEKAQVGAREPEALDRWLKKHFRPWEAVNRSAEDDDGSTIVAAGGAPPEEDDEDEDSKDDEEKGDGDGDGEGPSEDNVSDDDDENDR